jgi:hypothetical protein
MVDHSRFHLNNYTGKELLFRIFTVVCPNDDCKKITASSSLGYAILADGKWQLGPDAIQEWNLLPSSEALVFPDYVPAPILADYEEACKIRDLSPKASATLSRRCLQGIIRDFWDVSKPRLFDEVEAIREMVDIDTWSAIDAVRQIGNIGAHMERDINVIIDVDSEEAQLLIGLIELLIKDWYIARHKRKEHLRTIIEIAKVKKL